MTALKVTQHAFVAVAKRWCAGQIGMALLAVGALVAMWMLVTSSGRMVYVVGGVAALGVLLLVIKYPMLGACFGAFAISSSIGEFVPHSVSVALLITGAALVVRKLLTRDFSWRVTPVAKWGILLVTWWTFSILWGNYYDYFSFENVYRVVLVVLIFSEVVRTPKQYVAVVMATGVGIAFTAFTTVHAMIEFFHTGTYGAIANLSSQTGAARFAGHWADFNYMALATVPFVGLVFSIFRSRTYAYLRVPAGIFLVCGIASILLSLSRAGILCLIIMFAIIIAAEKRKWLWLLGLSLVVGALLMVLPIDLGGRLETLFKPRGDASLQQRTQLALAGLRAFSEHGLLGIGMSNFLVSSSDYIWNLGNESLVHNSFLEVGVESGVLGVVLLCGALCATLLRTKPRPFRIDSHNLGQTLLVCQSAAVVSVIFGMMTLSAANFVPLWLVFALSGITRTVFEQPSDGSIMPVTCRA